MTEKELEFVRQALWTAKWEIEAMSRDEPFPNVAIADIEKALEILEREESDG